MNKRIKIYIYSSLLFLLLVIGTFQTNGMTDKSKILNIDTHLALTPHDPILIEDDDNFTHYGFPGSGIAEDPYRIENYNITTDYWYAIAISNVATNFIIQNCYVQAYLAGIFVSLLSVNHIAKITNNFIEKFAGYGIAVEYANGTEILDNTCTLVSMGIYVKSSSNILLMGNNCSTNNYGAGLVSTLGCVVRNNHFEDNNFYGLTLGVEWNQVESQENAVYHNNFVENFYLLQQFPQGFDDGLNNLWYDHTIDEGNYWSDWVSGSYAIDGEAGSFDYYPLSSIIVIPEFTYSYIALFLPLGLLCLVYLLKRKKC